MIDGEVRELGRRARIDDDPEARLAWLVARLRAGLKQERLVIAAWAGDPAARRLLGAAAPVPVAGLLVDAGVAPRSGAQPRARPWSVMASGAGKRACAEAICAALEVADGDARAAEAVASTGRAWSAARDRVAAGERLRALQGAVAALSAASGLAAGSVAALVETCTSDLRVPGAVRRAGGPDALSGAAPRLRLALAGELLVAVVLDATHRFPTLAAVALRGLQGAGDERAVDAAARAALIAHVLR